MYLKLYLKCRSLYSGVYRYEILHFYWLAPLWIILITITNELSVLCIIFWKVWSNFNLLRDLRGQDVMMTQLFREATWYVILLWYCCNDISKCVINKEIYLVSHHRFNVSHHRFNVTNNFIGYLKVEQGVYLVVQRQFNTKKFPLKDWKISCSSPY